MAHATQPIRIHSDDPRLKRRINHDPRSRAYRVDTSGLTLADVDHPCRVGIFDQGQVGSCTAQSAGEVLATDPFWAGVSADVQTALEAADPQPWLQKFYSDEEDVDGDGPFPPNDNGSDGLTAGKVAKARGLISGYQHAFTADDALLGLQKTAALWGTLWKSGMDAVNESTGQVKYSGTTRGGHELSLYKIVAAKQQLWFRNHWGAWGYQRSGVAWISFDDFAKSLADQGDATFFVPLSQPAPVPTPTPTPSSGLTVDLSADEVATVSSWANSPHIWRRATAAAKVLKAHGL